MSVRALTHDDLEKLSTVRVITEFLIVKGLQTVQSLSFLRNLEDIKGRETAIVDDDGRSFPVYASFSLIYCFTCEIQSLTLYTTNEAFNVRFYCRPISMVIKQNDNLQYLGLSSLKHIRDRTVFIKSNHRLCFVDSINWTKLYDERSHDIRSQVEEVSSTAIEINVTECGMSPHFF